VSNPRSLTFSTIPYHGLTFVYSAAQELETREPQTWAEILGKHYIAANKREETRDVSVSDDAVYNAALHHLLTREPEPYVMSHLDFYQTRDLADDIGKVGINDLPDIL